MSITVSTGDIVDIIARHAREVIPRLEAHAFKPTDSLKALGANSIDRADIIMMTLETLGVNIPLIHLAKAENIADLARIIHEKS